MSAPDSPTSNSYTDEPAARVAWLESELAGALSRIAELLQERDQITRERDELRASYDRLWVEVELMRRRLFVAKAERIDATQLELEFKDKLAALDALAGTLGIDSPLGDESGNGAGNGNGAAEGNGEKPPSRPKPRGRRDLRTLTMPEERLVLPDPEFESLVERGLAERIGFEESCKLAWQKGGPRRVVVARVKYRVAGDQPETTQLATAPMPPQLFPRALATVSLIARIIVDKHCDGLPLNRQQDRFERNGISLDRGTMCRWLEHAGGTLGATVIEAMRKEAMKTAFCIASDATGVAVQPIADKGRRQSCRRGHYFVQIADRDHVFFEYTPKEDGAAVGQMFKGFSGYVQVDAKSVFNVLFEPPPDGLSDEQSADLPVRKEVGCWSHARRKFWEATIAKDAVAREGLARIGRLFDLERKWKERPVADKKVLRAQWARPHLDAFFAWVDVEYARVKDQRGLLRTALGYAARNKDALLRYLDDGRLEMTNNGSERQLRRIAVGRKAWLFVGSDDHAQAAGHLLSLIASARLHRLDPERYLRDLLRVLPHWPRDRYLELSPRYWARTRERLHPVELAAELGPLTIPPLLSTTEQQ